MDTYNQEAAEKCPSSNRPSGSEENSDLTESWRKGDKLVTTKQILDACCHLVDRQRMRRSLASLVVLVKNDKLVRGELFMADIFAPDVGTPSKYDLVFVDRTMSFGFLVCVERRWMSANERSLDGQIAETEDWNVSQNTCKSTKMQRCQQRRCMISYCR